METRNVVLSVPLSLFKMLNEIGFINGATPSTLTNEWVCHKIQESANLYIERNGGTNIESQGG